MQLVFKNLIASQALNGVAAVEDEPAAVVPERTMEPVPHDGATGGARCEPLAGVCGEP